MNHNFADILNGGKQEGAHTPTTVKVTYWPGVVASLVILVLGACIGFLACHFIICN